MIVSVMRIAPDGEEEVAVLKRPGIDRDAANGAPSGALGAPSAALSSVWVHSPFTATP